MRYELFNINQYVKVKLTPAGLQRHRERFDALCASIRARGREPGLVYTPPRVDAEGWHAEQLWSLMQTWGDMCGMTGPQPFETDILVSNERDAEPTPEPAPAAPTSTPKRVLKL